MRIRVAAFLAVATFAVILSACGGGGSSPIPATGGGGSTPTPASTPTPTPVPTPTLAPQTQSTTGPVTTAAGSSFSLGAVSNGTAAAITSATVTLPALSAAGTATAMLSASVPTGDPVPQHANLKGRFTLGVPNTPLAYITVTFAQSETVTATPAFTVVFPSNVTITPGNAYLVVYSGALGSWSELAGPITVVASNTIALASVTVSPPFTLTANVPYVFAIITTGSMTIATPSPTPSATPTPSPTPTSTSTASPSSGTTARPTQNPSPANSGSVIAGPTFAPCTPNCLGGYGPALIANTFQFPVQSGYNGSGQTVAIVMDYNIVRSDLTTYLSTFGVTQTGTFSTENVNGGEGTDASGQGESTLDVETISGLAPGANVTLYLIPQLTVQNTVDAYNQILSDGVANVVNSSFGGCEYANMTSEDTVLGVGALEGVAWVASSGDQGNECATGTGYQLGVNYPASDPNVIGVGGNETYPLSHSPYYNVSNPVAWNDTKCSPTTLDPSGACATGGGVSDSWTIPAYQVGLSGAASSTMRNVPDISMPAEYTATYENGAWGISAGTSWSAPQAAALMAEVYQYCGGGPFAKPVSAFYNVYAGTASDFFDITSGNNQFGGATPFYTATAGYDNATGLGSPLGMPFAQKVCVNRVNPGLVHRRQVAMMERGAATARNVDLTPRVAGLTDLGRRAATSATRIQIVVRPTSTVASDEAAAIAVLQQAGFTIVQTFSNHLVIDARGPSSAVESLFSTTMHNVAQAGNGTAYMPVGTVTIPGSLNPYVAAVTLDDVVIFHTGPHSATLMRR